MRNLTIICSLMTLLLAGCGGGSVERHDLSGTANFDGEPIVYGTIEFIAKHGEDVDAPNGSATIENGKYDTANSGQGIVAGPHEIRISAYSSKPAEVEDETVEVEPVEPLFVEFPMEAEIKPPTYDINVPSEAAGHNPFSQSRRPRNEP